MRTIRSFIFVALSWLSFTAEVSALTTEMNKIAVITGANKGIGKAIASNLATCGMFTHVILGCRDEALAKTAVDEISSTENACNVSSYQLTIGDNKSHASFCSAIEDKFGKVDVLVNNAGMAFKGSDPTPFEKQCKPTLDVNFRGTVAFTENMLPLVRKGTDARIVTVASYTGKLSQLRSKELQNKFSSSDLTKEELHELVNKYEHDVNPISITKFTAADSELNTNEDYNENRIKFDKRKGTRTKPLRVLDLFAGIGSGTVILKKLGIPLEKVVHVEHDPVAVEVTKFNHQNDNIDHVYISTFEEIYGDDNEGDAVKIGKLIHDFGPFELVLSAAPCRNHSQVNAFRNKDDYSAQYLLKAGRIIKKINAIQKDDYGYDEVLFLSENVFFRGKDNLELICKCYGNTGTDHGLCPIDLDASDFSPCRRRRFYWTNIPLEKSIDRIKGVAADLAVPDPFLDEGFTPIERAMATKAEKDFMTIKANTFMATTSRIDDDRMVKVKVDGDKFILSTYSVREREIMIGLPEGYVQKAMKHLFEKLTFGGFQKPETESGARYKSCLDKDLLHFAKQCRFKTKTKLEHPFFQLEISDPLEGREAYSFYDEEGYSKHLIGNGWTIPVVEHLLEPLRGLFDNDSFLQSYDKKYKYEFPWEPYTSKEKAQPVQEAEI